MGPPATESTAAPERTMRVMRKNGTATELRLRTRIDTPVELELYRHGGILPYVFRRFLPGT